MRIKPALLCTRRAAQLDIRQLRLVWEALHERATMLALAPHLAHPLPIFTVSTMQRLQPPTMHLLRRQ
jgi:glycerol-3-phosphate dehydrogenase